MKLLIKNGHVIDPKNNINTTKDVYIIDNKISAIRDQSDPITHFNADKTIDAKNHIVCPGLVDLRNRLREPGFKQKGSISSETYAAVAGGVTSVCCPPDTKPVIDSRAVIKQIRSTAESEGFCHVLPMAAMTKQLEGKELSEMVSLISSGCVGVSNALKPITNTLVQRRVMEYAASHDIKVFLHPQDPWLSNNGCAHEGLLSSRMGLTGIPESAETIALLRDLELIKLTGVKAHICQISTAKGVDIIRQAKAEGLDITADVTAHHLHLTEMDIDCFNSNCHVMPPLRSIRDQDALKYGLQDGTIDAIVSDHQPHDADVKLAPFAETESGISSVETLLSLAIKTSEQTAINLFDIIKKLSYNPAKILEQTSGSLSEGSTADVCIFDPNKIWQVDSNKLKSHGKNTPFHGWELKGKVVTTIVSGRIRYSD